MKRIAKLLLALGIATASALAGTPASAQPSEAPPSLRRFVSELPPGERRAVIFRLRHMDPARRELFFENWRAMSEGERAEQMDRWRHELREARKTREAMPQELREEFRGMSIEERWRAREMLRRLPPDRRTRLQQAIQHWDELTPEQREKVRGHIQRLRRFSEERRARIERNRPVWEEMKPAERERLRRRLDSFRALPPERQEALVDERFSHLSPEERALTLRGLRAR